MWAELLPRSSTSSLSYTKALATSGNKSNRKSGQEYKEISHHLGDVQKSQKKKSRRVRRQTRHKREESGTKDRNC